MVSDSGGSFIGEEVTSRGFEELQHCCVLPIGRVRHVDYYRSAIQHLGQSFSCDGVNARIWRCRYGFLSLRTKLGNELGSDESGAADYYDFHDCLLCEKFTWNARSAWLSV